MFMITIELTTGEIINSITEDYETLARVCDKSDFVSEYRVSTPHSSYISATNDHPKWKNYL